MKTHELASALNALAKVLRKLPNQPVEGLGSTLAQVSKPDAKAIPLALSTLVALSDIDKSQWISFIREQGFPIEVRPRDAARDLIGKILNHLAENPEARRRVASFAQRGRSDSSPELMRALELLLKE